jgi:hypothetical protein
MAIFDEGICSLGGGDIRSYMYAAFYFVLLLVIIALIAVCFSSPVRAKIDVARC